MSAVTTVVAVEGQRGRGEQRHDGFVLDINLGSGGEIAGQQQPSGCDSALLAVHE